MAILLPDGLWQGESDDSPIRLNLATAGITDHALTRQRFQAAVARMQRRQWHVQLKTHFAIMTALKDLVTAAPVPVYLTISAGPRPHSGCTSRVLPIW